MRKLKFSKGDVIIDVPCEPGTEPGAIAAMTAQGFTLMAEESDPASASQDLKRSKAEFFRSAGRLLLVLATATAPAAGVWFQQNAEMSKTNAKAKVSLRAAAVEKASNDKAWEAVVAKIEVLSDVVRKQAETQKQYKEALIRYEERVAALGRRHGVQPQSQIQIEVHDPNGELDEAKLGKKRPKPEPDGIVEAQRQLQLQFQDEP